MDKRGIILLSLGSPYYARMAANVAYSIKCNCDLPITLISNNYSILNDEDLKHFDNIVVPEKFIYTKNNKTEYFKAKTFIFDYTPYEETLYLDVDMVVLNEKKLNILFDELSVYDLVFASRGCEHISVVTDKTSQWGDVSKFAKQYNITDGYWYQLSSEFIYFKKKENVKEFFKQSQSFYENTTDNYLPFAGCIADELAFGMAMMITGLYNPISEYTPIYWAQAEKRIAKPIDPFINQNYYGYSMGHAYNYPQQKQFYNNMMLYYYNSKGRKGQFFPAQNKKIFVPQRERI